MTIAMCDCLLTIRRLVNFGCLVGQSSTPIYVAVPNSPGGTLGAFRATLLALVILAATTNV